MNTFKCIICSEAVDEDIAVSVLLDPPKETPSLDEGTPFMLNISPCCGKQPCVEKAWEQVKKSTIGEIEIDHYDESELLAEEEE
jgi:hypothetical protein